MFNIFMTNRKQCYILFRKEDDLDDLLNNPSRVNIYNRYGYDYKEFITSISIAC